MSSSSVLPVPIVPLKPWVMPFKLTELRNLLGYSLNSKLIQLCSVCKLRSALFGWSGSVHGHPDTTVWVCLQESGPPDLVYADNYGNLLYRSKIEKEDTN